MRERDALAAELTASDIRRGRDEPSLAWRDIVACLPGPVVVFDNGGMNIYANETLQTYAGLSADALAGQGWLDTIDPADLELVRRTWQASVESGEPFETECRLRRSDGEARWFLCRCRPLRDGAGEVAAWIGVGMDIQERKVGELRLALAMEAARLGEWSVDATGSVRFSDRAAEIYGWGEERLIPRERVLERLHEDDREAVVAAFRDAVANHRQFDTLYRLRRGPNDVAWAHGRGQALYNAAGEPVMTLGVIEDATARKAADEAERLRLREVDHRAKNLLMIVQALVRLTPFSSRSDYVDSLLERIQVLARSFHIAAEAEDSGVRLDEAIMAELAPFARADRQKLTGPVVIVMGETLQPLAMIFHELCTNAAKYGALASLTGTLSIQWSMPPGRDLELDWEEHGCAPRSGPPRQGFGAMLLDRSAAQLDGKLDRQWLEDGVKFTLTLGASHFRAAEGASPAR
jgi:PAS domain S-box-containing protein